MFGFPQDQNERRIFFRYVIVSLSTFLVLASINFGLIAHDLRPVNIIIPFIIGTVMGILLAHNKLLQIRLSRSNNTKSQFLARMNHELRTPMNAIIGFASLLRCSDNLTEGEKEEVEHILYAGNHTISLITELLDFAKIETGNIHLSPIELLPGHVLLHSIDMVKSLADKNGITIEYNIPEKSAATINADEVRLIEVFVNILSNAIKYNKQNGKIKIDCQQEKDKFKITISDNGIGIDQNQLPYLYEPFNRLGAEKTDIEGTGVGLVITRSLVEMMSGDISCESEFGKGTSFTLKFPLSKSQVH